MSHPAAIKVFLTGQTRVNRETLRKWLDHVGATKFQIDTDATDSEVLLQTAGKRCYMSFQVDLNRNLTKVREDMAEFIGNILQTKHGSVLEHVVFNFALEGVSRVFTAEMNRHRAGWSISEGSLRYIRFDDIPYWLPDCIRANPADSPDLVAKKRATRDLFAAAFEQDQTNYAALESIWADELASNFKGKKQITSMMRRVIGIGVSTGGVWSGNIRALRWLFTLRCSPEAEEEILCVANMMLEAMREAEPLLFGDFYKDVDGYWRPKHYKV